ncbi:hypothetical protein [Sphingobacterium sp.]|uniref:hypothetical protein n=1 Tax=Sphingobacterium sp. TaxID=341027 RepID=UPI002FDDD8DD
MASRKNTTGANTKATTINKTEKPPTEQVSKVNQQSSTIDNSNTGDNSTASVNKPLSSEEVKVIPVIIPYLKSAAAGDELKMAIRSMERNFNFPFTVIVVGDREEWFADKIVHIPHEPHVIVEDCGCPNPSHIIDPQADVAHKLLTAITALGIEDKFILTNDDIFVLEPQTLAQIEILKRLPNSLYETGAEGSAYKKNALRTAEFLKANGCPTYNFGTHTPMVFDAEDFTDMLANIPTTEKGYLLESLYFNALHPNARPLVVNGSSAHDGVLGSVYKSQPNMDVIEPAFKSRWYFNCNTEGYKAIEPLLLNEFPEPSSFEK